MTSHTVDRYTQQDLDGERTGMLALQEQRQAANLQPLPARELVADMPEDEFARALVRIKTRQTRMQRIIDTVLVEGAHYGNPVDARGKKAFKEPILYQAGAEELRQFFRLTPQYTEPMQVVQSPEYVSVVVTLGMYDSAGRLLGTKPGACNSMERRFKRFDGKGYIYADAREVLHDCIAMAEKRASSRLTREVTGATAFFANRDEMDEGLDDDRPITPWTDAEKKQVYAAAQKARVGRAAFRSLMLDTLGRDQIGSGDDVTRLLEAIAKYQRPTGGPKAVAEANDSYGRPEPEPATPVDDAALDAEIAAQERDA